MVYKLLQNCYYSIYKSHLVHFPVQTQKTKKNQPEKKFLYFQKWNFLALILKKFLYSLKRKLFQYFLKRKLFLYFRKWNPAIFNPSSENKKIHPEKMSYTLGNRNRDKFGNLKNFLYFRK